MAPATLVPTSVGYDHCYAIGAASVGQPVDDAPRPERTSPSETSLPEAFETDSFSYLWEELRSQGVPSTAASYILNAWRDSTKSQYHLYFKKWIRFLQATSV